MKVKYRVEGLRAVDKALQELVDKHGATRREGRITIKRALRRAGKRVVASAKKRVPVQSGKLKDSITASDLLSKSQRSKHVAKSQVETFIGAGPLRYAHIVEFGSRRSKANPFLRPAWDAGRKRVLATLVNSFRTEIAKTARRLEAKAKLRRPT